MLKAGFARVDMTPPLGSPMAGYFEYREAEGILDPLELNAIAVTDGENTILVVTADILYTNEVFATNVRQCIEKRTGVPADHVFLQGLHQHTSVALGATVQSKSIANSFYDAPYQNVLIRKYEDVCVMAIADMTEAAIGIAQQETAEPISFIRRFRMKDGSVRTNPGFLNPNILEPIGEADNTVRLVRFHREGAKDIALVNFSTHPDVIGGCKFSADWPGFVRRMTEQDIPDTHCILVNGAQGDTNHVNTSKPSPFIKDDPKLQEKKYAHSRFMGRTITDVVMALWDHTTLMDDGKVSGFVKMEYIPTNTTYMDRVEEFKEKKKLMQAGEGNFTMEEKGEINRVIALPEETLFRKVPVSMVAFGKIALVGFGGEPFTEYATKVREGEEELFIICACCANGGQGYLPTQSAFDEGGYEARSSRFTSSVATVLPAAAKEMLAKHKKKI